MPKKLISQIFTDVSKISSRAGKIEELQKYKNEMPVVAMLKYTLDPKIEFALPEGAPPYKVSEDLIDDPGTLYREIRKMNYFIKGKSDNIHPIKRETLFIQLLESLHPEEAKLVLAMKEKKMPYKGITLKLVQEAFPGLIKV